MKAMEQDPDIVYVIPKEGSTLFIDNLAIPVTARIPISRTPSSTSPWSRKSTAEICRTMHYSTTSREALPLLPLDHPQQSGDVSTANGLRPARR